MAHAKTKIRSKLGVNSILITMAVHDLFSKRRRRISGEVPDVFTYDTIPKPLRVQLVQLINEGIGNEGYDQGGVYNYIHKTLCREYGMSALNSPYDSDWKNIESYILNADNAEHIVDAVELSMQMIDTFIRHKKSQYHYRHAGDPDGVIDETNHRFREHGVGYEYILGSGEILRIDSKFTHAEIVKPALVLLANDDYAGANDEYLAAHTHFRHSRYKECLLDCLKCFESTMKIILLKKGVLFDEKRDTAQKLISLCVANKLFPAYLDSQLSAVRSLLESGIPTVRNRNAGHGQGTQIIQVPEHLAAYALHLTAANVLLLVRSAETLSQEST